MFPSSSPGKNLLDVTGPMSSMSCMASPSLLRSAPFPAGFPGGALLGEYPGLPGGMESIILAGTGLAGCVSDAAIDSEILLLVWGAFVQVARPRRDVEGDFPLYI